MTEDLKMDINFLEACTWAVNRRDNDGPLVSGNGKYVVTGGEKGIPNDVDYRVLLYLLCLVQDNGWMQSIDLSQYTPSSLIKGVRGTTSNPNGKIIDRFFETLERYSDLNIKFLEDSYVSRDKNKKVTKTTESFNVLSFSRQTNPPRVEFNGFFLEKLRESLHYRHMSLREYRNIGNPTAMRLFELLEKSFLKGTEWKINVKGLADKVGISAKYVSHIVPKLETAMKRINSATGDRYELATDTAGNVLVDNECVIFFRVGDEYRPTFSDKPKAVPAPRPKAKPKAEQAKDLPPLHESVLAAIPASHRTDKALLQAFMHVVDQLDERHAIILAESVDPGRVKNYASVVMGMKRDGKLVSRAEELAAAPKAQTTDEKMGKNYRYVVGILHKSGEETFRKMCKHRNLDPEKALAWAKANPDQDPRNKK